MNYRGRPLKVFVAAGPRLSQSVCELVDKSMRLALTGSAEDGESAIARLETDAADVVVIDYSLPGISGVKVAEFLAGSRPDMVCVLLSEERSTDRFRGAMLAGAREFILWPVSAGEFELSLVRVSQIAREHARREPMLGASVADRFWENDGRWVVVAGGKGGVGTSFVAANLAGSFSENPLGVKTALVDFDLTSADLSGVLNVEPPVHLNDLLNASSEMDEGLLRSAAFQIDRDFDLFPGPVDIESRPLFSREQAGALIQCWRRLYDLVVVDLGTYIDESAVAVLSAADMIVPIVVPEVISVRAAARLMRLLERLGVNEGVIHPVVNRSGAGHLGVDRISSYIGAPVLAGLPDSPCVASVLDEGRLLTSDDDPDLKRSIDSLAAEVLRHVGLAESSRVR